MATFNCIVTNAGRNLIATAMAGGQTVNLINVKTGNGQIGAGNAYNLTDLINDIQDYSIDGSNSLTPYQTSVQFTVNSANVSISYQMYEAGLFAKIGSGGAPTLLWYGYTTSPDTITPSGSSNATIDVNQLAIVYSNATTCVATQTPTVTVPPHAITHIQDTSNTNSGFDPIPVSTTTSTGLLTRLSGLIGDVFRGNGTWSNLAALVNAIVFPHATKHISTGSDPIPPPSTTASGLVLPNPNDVTQVYCGSNPPSWQPTVLRISNNVTLYVATNGNNSTALTYLAANFPAIPNNSASPFLTLQGALNWLSFYLIPVGFTVTINIAAGVYNSSSAVTINHPNGSQILIVGATPIPVNTTSASFSGTTVTLNASAGSFSGWVAGDAIMVNSVSSVSAGIASGAQIILTCNGSTSLTYNCGYGALTSLSGAVFNVKKLPTVLSFSAGISGLQVTGNLQSVSNIALIGAGSGSIYITGMSVSGECSVVNCLAYGWTDSVLNSAGFIVSLGSLSLNTCYSNRNSNGQKAVNNATLNASSCVSNINSYGYRIGQAQAVLSFCSACGNLQAGYNVQNFCGVTMGSCVGYNNVYGVICSGQSGIYVNGTNACAFTGNASKDIDIYFLSSYNRIGGPVTSYSSLSANITGVNVLTADGCLFNP